MKYGNTRRRALGLLSMLALIPMLLVITGVSAKLISRVLRVQREATYRVVNTEMALRLADLLQTDAGRSATVTLGEDQSLTLKDSDSKDVVRYEIANGVATRVTAESGIPSESRWSFVHAKLDWKLEDVGHGPPIIWMRVEYEVELRKRVVQVGQIATAIHVGGTGAMP